MKIVMMKHVWCDVVSAVVVSNVWCDVVSVVVVLIQKWLLLNIQIYIYMT